VLVSHRGRRGRLLDAFCPHLAPHLGLRRQGEGRAHRLPVPCLGIQREACASTPLREEHSARADGKQTVHAYPVVEATRSSGPGTTPSASRRPSEVNCAEVGHRTGRSTRLRVEIRRADPGSRGERRRRGALVYRAHLEGDSPREITHEAHKRFCALRRQGADMDEHGNIDRTGTRWREQPARDRELRPRPDAASASWPVRHDPARPATPIDSETMHLRFCFIQRKGMSCDLARDLVGQGLWPSSAAWRSCPCAG